MGFDEGSVRFYLFLPVFILSMAIVAGCHKGPATARVRGTVKYKDGTIPNAPLAIVRFTSAESAKAEIRKGATGSINPDGTFEMVTRKPGDGVYLGKYNVSFAIIRNPGDLSTSLIAPKYMNPSESGITETITGDKDDLHYVIERLPGAAATASRTPGKNSGT